MINDAIVYNFVVS